MLSRSYHFENRGSPIYRPLQPAVHAHAHSTASFAHAPVYNHAWSWWWRQDYNLASERVSIIITKDLI